MGDKYYISEEEMKKALFPDDFIAWLINEIDICDEHITDFDDLINVKEWLIRKEILQEVRNKYQRLILDKHSEKLKRVKL